MSKGASRVNMNLKDFRQIDEFEWEIRKNFQKGMRVPVIFFADEKMINESLHDASVQQAINATYLPGVLEKVCVMPDVHQGYGFPIGGVAATSMEDGVISPGAIGYDINCGVRLMASNLDINDVETLIGKLINQINTLIPSGVGKGGRVKLSKSQVEDFCINGARWAAANGFAEKDEISYIEDGGRIKGANPSSISLRASQRGLPQLGSLGAGNHFIEIDVVEKIFDIDVADALDLHKSHLAIQIHSGSRGLGHQVCSDYVKKYQSLIKKYKFNLPDRELMCAPIQSYEGKEYLSAMRCAANYAFANRQVLAHYVREAFNEVLTKTANFPNLQTVYDLAHNIGKIENHKINGKMKEVCVHRKGATRAFGPGHPDIPAKYMRVGQPVLIPGSMGTSSWVMVGTNLTDQKSFGSCSHGAGRVMSRSKARRSIRGEEVRQRLHKYGIKIKAGSMSGLAEEAPEVYKDVNQVIRCIEGVGLARRVAKLKPIAVIKG